MAAQLGFEALGWLLVLGALVGTLAASWRRWRTLRFEPIHLEPIDPKERRLELDEWFQALELRLEPAGFSFRSHLRRVGPYAGAPAAHGVAFEHPATGTWLVATLASLTLDDGGLSVELCTFRDEGPQCTRAGGFDLDPSQIPDRLEEIVSDHLAQLPEAGGRPVELETVLSALAARFDRWRDRRWLRPAGEGFRLGFRGTLRFGRTWLRQRWRARRAYGARREAWSGGAFWTLPVRVELEQLEMLEQVAGPVGRLRSHRWRAWIFTGGLVVAGGLVEPALGLKSALFVPFVLVLHEFGHAVAMKVANAWDPDVFFVPGIGALGRRPAQLPSWGRRLAVRLAGPLPGLLLGVVLLQDLDAGLDQQTRERLWKAGWMLVGINGLHLGPGVGLDGGAIFGILFGRSVSLATAVFGLPGMALLGMGAVLPSPALALLGAVTLSGWIPWRRGHRLARAVAGRAPDARGRRPALVDALRGLRGRVSMLEKLRLIGVAETALARPAPATGRLLFGVVLYGAFGGAGWALLTEGTGAWFRPVPFPPMETAWDMDLTAAQTGPLPADATVLGWMAARDPDEGPLRTYAAQHSRPLLSTERTALFVHSTEEDWEEGPQSREVRRRLLRVASGDWQYLLRQLKQTVDRAVGWSDVVGASRTAWLTCTSGRAEVRTALLRGDRLVGFGVLPPWNDPDPISRDHADARAVVAQASAEFRRIRGAEHPWVQRIRSLSSASAGSRAARLAADLWDLDRWAEARGALDSPAYRAFKAWARRAAEGADARAELRRLQGMLDATPGAGPAELRWPFGRSAGRDAEVHLELVEPIPAAPVAVALSYLARTCESLRLRVAP